MPCSAGPKPRATRSSSPWSPPPPPATNPLLNPNGLDTADPTQYPDTNPLLDKFPGTEPTAQTVADYADGLLAIQTVFDNDPAYTYRGTDPTTINAHPDRTALDTSPRYHKTDGSD